MNELIDVRFEVHTDENDTPTISGRELHAFLEVKERYNDWFPRMCEYGFSENADYFGFTENSVKPQGGRPALDHDLTIPMAKELSMIQRTDRGKMARQYFIQIEEAWNRPEMVMARALKMADKQIAMIREANVKLREQIEEQKPLVQLAEICMSSKDSLLVRDFAKLLCKNGFNIGEKRLFQMLRDQKMLYRKEGRNLPYQEYVDRGYFEVTESPYIADGEVKLALTTRIAPKGQKYIADKLAIKGMTPLPPPAANIK